MRSFLSFPEKLLVFIVKIFQASSHQRDSVLEAFMLLEQLDGRKLSSNFFSYWELTRGVQDHSGFKHCTNSLTEEKCSGKIRVMCLNNSLTKAGSKTFRVPGM